MTATPESIEAQILLHPIQTVRTRLTDEYTISDPVARLLNYGGGASVGAASSDASDVANQFTDQPVTLATTLDIVHLLADKPCTAIFGSPARDQTVLSAVVISPLLYHQNCYITPRLSSDPVGLAKFPDFPFRATQGQTWETAGQDAPPQFTGIQYVGTPAYKVVIAQSVKSLPAYQQMVFYIHWMGLAKGQNDKANYRIAFSDGLWSFAFRQGCYMTLDKKDGANWDITHIFNDGPVCDYTGDWTVSLRSEHGYLIVGLNDKFYYLLDTTPAVGAQPARQIYFKWPKGKLTVSSYGVEAKLSLALLSKLETNGQQRTGTATRTVARTISRATGSQMTIGQAAGYQTQAMPLPVQATADDKSVTWTATLTAAPDGSDGPALTHVHTKFAGSFNPSTSDPPRPQARLQ